MWLNVLDPCKTSCINYMSKSCKTTFGLHILTYLIYFIRKNRWSNLAWSRCHPRNIILKQSNRLLLFFIITNRRMKKWIFAYLPLCTKLFMKLFNLERRTEDILLGKKESNWTTKFIKLIRIYSSHHSYSPTCLFIILFSKL